MNGRSPKLKPDYGFDGSPWAVAALCLVGVGCLAWGHALLASPRLGMEIAAALMMLCGALLVFLSGSYLYYTKVGKLHRRDRMLSRIDWTGSERVLDLGTGRGLLMIGAAKRLTTGTSVGIDIWNAADLHGNTVESTLKNAEIEGVLDRVEVREEDARNLSFPDDSFDVVLSNLCLHNIPTPVGREKACREIARVLKPKGTAILADKSGTMAYGAILAREGLTVEHPRTSFDGSLCRMVIAVKN
jgi:SAM-dependent methyltransferase